MKMFVALVKGSVTQLCPTLCDPVGCSPPGSSVHGILQARILERVAIPFSRGFPSGEPGVSGPAPCRQGSPRPCPAPGGFPAAVATPGSTIETDPQPTAIGISTRTARVYAS